MTKALLIRTHALCTQFTDRLFELFAEEGINWHTAKTFGDIVSVDEVLTKKNHAVVKVETSLATLSKQRSSHKDPSRYYTPNALLTVSYPDLSRVPKIQRVASLSFSFNEPILPILQTRMNNLHILSPYAL